jgi:hypothetical protein
MDWQKIAPAFSALPPSMAVACRGHRDVQERRCPRMDRQKIAPAFSARPPSMAVEISLPAYGPSCEDDPAISPALIHNSSQ